LTTTPPPLPLGRASLLASSAIREAVRMGLPEQSLTAVGGVRRYAPTIAHPTLLGAFAPAHQRDVLDRLATLPMVSRVCERTTSMVRIETFRGELTVHVTDPDHTGAALVWYTGSRRHRDALCARAAHRDLLFADGQLRGQGGTPLAIRSEEDLYRCLDLPCIPPELREGRDEIAAAEQGRLPALITADQIRGDLHMHTSWSDGRDTVESMVLAARSLGYEYVAITDHSERAWSARKLSAADVPRQRDEIDAVREAVPDVTVLHGVEVDIMHDGSLDFEDAILDQFDVVLASLHDRGEHSGPELTDRYLAAIRHPLVNVITHLANRSPGFFEGYDLDFDRIFAAAVETGTALEIDGAPGHLDMDGFLARRAIDAGVVVTIDGDCHRSDALARQMRFGVGTARRGWIGPSHVLNTRGVADVRGFVAKKRAGR
jgi:DNA polymerase (family 10)